MFQKIITKIKDTVSKKKWLITKEVNVKNVDIKNPETRSEINRNLDLALSPMFHNPMEAWEKASKILSMYNIFPPKVMFLMRSQNLRGKHQVQNRNDKEHSFMTMESAR